jgi:hypothetical protein
MPIDPRINMMYQSPEFKDVNEIMANAETVKLARKKNAMADMELQDTLAERERMNSPEYQAQQEQEAARGVEEKKSAFLKSQLPFVQDQASYDSMKAKAVRLFGQEADDNFPAEFDPVMTDKIKLHLGITKPEKEIDQESAAMNRAYKQAMIDAAYARTNPELQRTLAQERAKGGAMGESAGKIESPVSMQEASEAQQALASIDKLISPDVDLESIYGRGESYYPDIARKQQNIDLMAENDRIVNLLKLASAGKLKGQGTITDPERAMLAQAATTLSNRDISGKAAKAEWERIRPQFEAIVNRGVNQGVLPPASNQGGETLQQRIARIKAGG